MGKIPHVQDVKEHTYIQTVYADILSYRGAFCVWRGSQLLQAPSPNRHLKRVDLELKKHSLALYPVTLTLARMLRVNSAGKDME